MFDNHLVREQAFPHYKKYIILILHGRHGGFF